jgi:arginine-tRNA-protein transferase
VIRIDAEPRRAEAVPCPYLSGESFVQRYFFAYSLSKSDLGYLLDKGWRHFSSFFFRPDCPSCQACEPVKIDAFQLKPSASQQRVLKKNADVEFCTVPLRYKDEYYRLWEHHSRVRFGTSQSPQDFERSFFTPVGEGFLTEYRLKGRLAGLGFCDLSDRGISSIYFVFHQDFASRSLGTFSVLRECQLARELNLPWYYLGYWIRQNPTMAYKGHFRPRQIFDWNSETWKKDVGDEPPLSNTQPRVPRRGTSSRACPAKPRTESP